MSERIIKPEGEELIEYLNNGYPICNECGAVMDRVDEPVSGCSFYVCPGCAGKVDVTEYEYDDGQEKEWAPGSGMEHMRDIPPGCLACGGPWPSCETACPLFDD